MEEIRIQKFLSEAGILSRRKAEEEISAGRVLVDGVPATTGQKIDPATQTVTYKGKLVEKPDRLRYFMFYKPRGVVCTMSDEKGRRCIADVIRESGLPVAVLPIGRLDLDSEGLLLLTNDGECINRLTHPSTSAAKIYMVKVSPEPSGAQVRTLRSPMVLDGYKIRPVEVETLPGFDAGLLRFTLHEGRNRQIRKMCESCGYKVIFLKRVAVGSLKLGELKAGQYRKLTQPEVDMLMKEAGDGEK
ncbi:MAG: rRNA pseudouridine synthase [Oscillospiraceae bacterium]|nr:rRNA pseudouridine synthase [Oscillospiraceae bacterium]